MKTVSTETRSTKPFDRYDYNESHCTHLEYLNEAMNQTGLTEYSSTLSTLSHKDDKYVLGFTTNIW